ncbi:hypothetical protein DICPUDRAFT_74314 [Dictyostelium purpureum]|uniref:Transmembrane protein n=1 Tax=Dictyostelium purpureum TaxID=5786 RepID=F0Z7D4_DICPU|nr:uncharacterized protein DICPUDRAFT_74314 [Dictyostelium purpureum]EGC40120.1 hypothetical protein DICPUDRAFT_74314 [Dictyostelium purpureum]|eukprot:XP_003283310.1 hypothetical protein DICPUDRAFT_74314 [Dictyostelium purpureum]
MIKIIIFILLNIILFVCGTTYVNFDPHPKCSQDVGVGIGYSWITNKCLNFGQDGSYLVEIDQNDQNNVNFYFFSDPKSQCNKAENNVTKQYNINNCYQVQWNLDGAFYDVTNYAKMSIVEDPGYIQPEGYRYTLYQTQDTQCQADYLYYQYYTNGIKFHNTMQTFLYECVDDVPFEVLCTQDLPCINSTIEFRCVTSESGPYLHSITC